MLTFLASLFPPAAYCVSLTPFTVTAKHSSPETREKAREDPECWGYDRQAVHSSQAEQANCHNLLPQEAGIKEYRKIFTGAKKYGILFKTSTLKSTACHTARSIPPFSDTEVMLCKLKRDIQQRTNDYHTALSMENRSSVLLKPG
ncbi:hypothetical protein KOW79_003540 [Hemibagrus wyckioides]|uniref:Uncharacterized protein n=1 Tax=Hemibagrus wyckioides TaxID=337641 RepID=A0A9D3P5K7_9TELE|nr:hypothetical protein KOW79_003540 [Hemibagrus wyckioides]